VPIRGLLVLTASVVLAGWLVGAVTGTRAAASAGSPDRGRAYYFGPGGCAGCHSASADPAEPSTGPQLTLETLKAHAAGAGKALADYVSESILVPGAYAAPGYVSGVMQPPRGLTTEQLEDLVSYLIGKPWTAPSGGPLRLPARPVAACDAKASCRSTVGRWARVERLPLKALPGAKIVAVSGCLSCHTYAGNGAARGAAPDLTRAGLPAATISARVRHLRCPSCVEAGSQMPSYKAYGDANLRRIAEFLGASRGVRP